MLKQAIEELAVRLKKLEDAARKLQNQNFADITHAAHSRVMQLTQHPDVEKVQEIMEAGRGEPAEDAPRPGEVSIHPSEHGGGTPFPGSSPEYPDAALREREHAARFPGNIDTD